MRAALELQAQFAAMFSDWSPERRIAFRMGVNVGDVWIDDEDVYGVGVNVAARLEGLADAGGICISDSVRDFVEHKIAVRFEDLGLRRVKNVAQPIRVWRVQSEVAPQVQPQATPAATRDAAPGRRAFVAAGAAGVLALALYFVFRAGSGVGTAEALAEPVTVAVLPFANVSADPEQRYCSDGLTDELINTLQRLPGLRVTGRTSAFAFRDSNRSLPEIAAALGVQRVVEGSVGLDGERLRIRVQLSDAEGFGLWSERYDPRAYRHLRRARPDRHGNRGGAARTLRSRASVERVDAGRRRRGLRDLPGGQRARRDWEPGKLSAGSRDARRCVEP